MESKNNNEESNNKLDKSQNISDNKDIERKLYEKLNEAKVNFNENDVDEKDSSKNEDDSDNTTHETLSRNNPISEFLRQQKGKLNGVTEEEFMSKFAAHLKESEDRQKCGDKEKGKKKVDIRNVSADFSRSSNRFNPINNIGSVDKIVLKFTTLSEATIEAPSFTIDSHGAKIGRDSSNEISVPSDTRLAPVGHATISYSDGLFYLNDGGFDFGASIRIPVAMNKRQQWAMEKNAQFSAGNCVFRSCGVNEDGLLVVEILEGPLRGERRLISKKGATLGRASDNIISVQDKELSRHHSRIDYDEKSGRYYVFDIGSTNGTYMQLVGPYAGRYKLNLNDHILVGRTGFSINRYDYGLCEEMGHRQAMEDSCTIVQHLNILPLNSPNLSPQSFFGVFDGHGGQYASAYLAANLHANVADGLAACSPELLQVIEDMTIEVDSEYENQINNEMKSNLQDGRDVNNDRDDNNNSQQEGEEQWERIGDDHKDEKVPDTEDTKQQENNHMKLLRTHSRTSTSRGQQLKKAMDDIVTKTLKAAFLKTDADFISTSEHANNGSTATTALVLGHRLYCANVGDSRTILCRNFRAVAMSQDHKPSREDEAKRIRDAGGFVINNRVMGELAVSRAFGDAEFKKGIQTVIEEEGLKMPTGIEGDGKNWDQPLITAEPDIQATSLTEDDQFLLLACDGLFDVFTIDDVVSYVRANLEQHGDAQKCCQV